MHISEGRIGECVANDGTICIVVLEGKFWCGSEAKNRNFEIDNGSASDDWGCMWEVTNDVFCNY